MPEWSRSNRLYKIGPQYGWGQAPCQSQCTKPNINLYLMQTVDFDPHPQKVIIWNTLATGYATNSQAPMQGHCAKAKQYRPHTKWTVIRMHKRRLARRLRQLFPNSPAREHASTVGVGRLGFPTNSQQHLRSEHLWDTFEGWNPAHAVESRSSGLGNGRCGR